MQNSGSIHAFEKTACIHPLPNQYCPDKKATSLNAEKPIKTSPG
jgi:hypothetical protein